MDVAAVAQPVLEQEEPPALVAPLAVGVQAEARLHFRLLAERRSWLVAQLRQRGSGEVREARAEVDVAAEVEDVAEPVQLRHLRTPAT